MALPIDISVVQLPAYDYGFTEDPLSAVARLKHSMITPAAYHEMRTLMETWYHWAKERDHAETRKEPHYWFIEIHRNDVNIELHRPYYQHDCDRCQFLGAFIDDHNLLHDLYYCTKGPGETFIARYGDEGHEYRSGALFVGLDPAITEADRRHRNDARDFIFSY